MSEENLNEFDKTEFDFYNIDLLPNCPTILSIREAAAVCNVSAQTITRMVDAGILPTVADSGDILRADLIEYIKHNALADKPVL